MLDEQLENVQDQLTKMKEQYAKETALLKTSQSDKQTEIEEKMKQINNLQHDKEELNRNLSLQSEKCKEEV